MNTQELKKLIRETVRDAVRDELVELFSQNQPTRKLVNTNPKDKKKVVRENLNFTSDDVQSIGYRSKLMDMMKEQFGQPSSVKPGNNYQLKSAPLPKEVVEDNPLAAFIADAAANMTPQELAGIKNMG